MASTTIGFDPRFTTTRSTRTTSYKTTIPDEYKDYTVEYDEKGRVKRIYKKNSYKIKTIKGEPTGETKEYVEHDIYFSPEGFKTREVKTRAYRAKPHIVKERVTYAATWTEKGVPLKEARYTYNVYGQTKKKYKTTFKDGVGTQKLSTGVAYKDPEAASKSVLSAERQAKAEIAAKPTPLYITESYPQELASIWLKQREEYLKGPTKGIIIDGRFYPKGAPVKPEYYKEAQRQIATEFADPTGYIRERASLAENIPKGSFTYTTQKKQFTTGSQILNQQLEGGYQRIKESQGKTSWLGEKAYQGLTYSQIKSKEMFDIGITTLISPIVTVPIKRATTFKDFTSTGQPYITQTTKEKTETYNPITGEKGSITKTITSPKEFKPIKLTQGTFIASPILIGAGVTTGFITNIAYQFTPKGIEETGQFISGGIKKESQIFKTRLKTLPIEESYKLTPQYRTTEIITDFAKEKPLEAAFIGSQLLFPVGVSKLKRGISNIQIKAGSKKVALTEFAEEKVISGKEKWSKSFTRAERIAAFEESRRPVIVEKQIGSRYTTSLEFVKIEPSKSPVSVPKGRIGVTHATVSLFKEPGQKGPTLKFAEKFEPSKSLPERSFQRENIGLYVTPEKQSSLNFLRIQAETGYDFLPETKFLWKRLTNQPSLVRTTAADIDVFSESMLAAEQKGFSVSGTKELKLTNEEILKRWGEDVVMPSGRSELGFTSETEGVIFAEQQKVIFGETIPDIKGYKYYTEYKGQAFPIREFEPVNMQVKYLDLNYKPIKQDVPFTSSTKYKKVKQPIIVEYLVGERYQRVWESPGPIDPSWIKIRKKESPVSLPKKVYKYVEVEPKVSKSDYAKALESQYIVSRPSVVGRGVGGSSIFRVSSKLASGSSVISQKGSYQVPKYASKLSGASYVGKPSRPGYYPSSYYGGFSYGGVSYTGYPGGGSYPGGYYGGGSSYGGSSLGGSYYGRTTYGKPPSPPRVPIKFEDFEEGSLRSSKRVTEQPRVFKPSIVGIFIGEKVKAAPTTTFTGADIRPVVITKQKKSRWITL